MLQLVSGLKVLLSLRVPPAGFEPALSPPEGDCAA